VRWLTEDPGQHALWASQTLRSDVALMIWPIQPTVVLEMKRPVIASPQSPNYSPDEYLQIEEHSPIKHEYMDRLIYAMVGVSYEDVSF
jgi:hypothetical protein